MDQSLGVWIVREDARSLGEFISQEIEGTLYTPSSFEDGTNKENFQAVFARHTSWVLVMTTGIAVRYLDALIDSKLTDPGVVVVDEGGRSAISLLSGHEGGANKLAYEVASLIDAEPVISTATESLKNIVIGVGCRKNISYDILSEALNLALVETGKTIEEVRHIASVDAKKEEPALLQWSKEHGVPLQIISSEKIKLRPWTYKPSDWVNKNLEIVGVCEPCALLTSHKSGLILPKWTFKGVAIAIAEERIYNEG